MNDLDRDRAGAAEAHRAVIASLQRLTDAEVRQPSQLPGWTVGHVATHIARNAEGQRRMLEAAVARRGRGDVSRWTRATQRRYRSRGAADRQRRSSADVAATCGEPRSRHGRR